jgi:hypothetical protein
MLATCVGMIALLASTLRVLLSASCMLPTLSVIAFAVMFIRSPVRLCGMIVKFSGFDVFGICHKGSVGPAPRAHQLTVVQAVPRSHGMVCSWLHKFPQLGKWQLMTCTSGSDRPSRSYRNHKSKCLSVPRIFHQRQRARHPRRGLGRSAPRRGHRAPGESPPPDLYIDEYSPVL